ncbi:hypothetical protein HHI36_005347 [Cryptolaemus montrouzieri]|uniref:Uncharacterized protein n=1 Tax=Cryptolaemus montrouzieri TaxID=559131 RepID=A0ABD2NUC6_9CUCU
MHYPEYQAEERVRRDRSKLVRTLKKCQMEADRYRSKYEKYKTRYQRLKLKTDKKKPSPRTRINRMIGKMRISEVIRKQLFFSEVMQAQRKIKNLRRTRVSRMKKIIEESFELEIDGSKLGAGTLNSKKDKETEKIFV